MRLRASQGGDTDALLRLLAEDLFRDDNLPAPANR
jgi:hypothetical protein